MPGSPLYRVQRAAPATAPLSAVVTFPLDFTTGALPTGVFASGGVNGTRVGADGYQVLSTYAPRFDYTPAGVSRGILVEPPRSNFSGYPSGRAIGFNSPQCNFATATGPDNTPSALLMTANGGTYLFNTDYFAGDNLGTSAVTFFYVAKYSNNQWFWTRDDYNFNGGTTPVWGAFDLLNGVKGNLLDTNTRVDAWGMEPLGNGYYECWITVRPSTSGAGYNTIAILGNASTPTNGNLAMAGTEECYLAYAGAYLGTHKTPLYTSEINTTTRNADAISFLVPAGVTDLRYTFDGGATQDVAVSSGLNYTIPTTLNDSRIKTIANITSGSGPVNGSASQSLTLVSQSAMADVDITGSSNTTLAALTQVGTIGALSTNGSASQTLGQASQTAIGTVFATASANQTLAQGSQTATGTTVAGAAYSAPVIGGVSADVDADFVNSIYKVGGADSTLSAMVLDRAGNAQDSDTGVAPSVDADGLVLTSTTQHHLWGAARTSARVDGVHVFEFDVSANSNNCILFFVGDDAFTSSAAHATLNSDGTWGLYQGPYVGRATPAVALGTLPTATVQRIVIAISGSTVKLVANGGAVTAVTQDTGVPEAICFGCSEETGLAQPEGRGKRYFHIPTTSATDTELSAMSVVGAGGGAPSAVNASASQTLAQVTQVAIVAVGTSGVIGVASQTLAQVTLVATADVDISGSSTNTLAQVTQIATARTLAATPYDGTIWDHGDGSFGTGFSHGTYSSASMGVTVGYTIYLPPGYSGGSDRYPVIYFLHGREGHENADPGHLDWFVNTAGGSVPAIVVFPNGGYDSKYMDPTPGSPMYGVEMSETTVIGELIPFIDATYRTIADRAHRALQGFSMGGQGVLRLGIKYNNLFSSLYAFSPAVVTYDFNVEANEPALLAAFFNNDPALFQAQTAKAQLNLYQGAIRSTLPIAFEVGGDDTFILDWTVDFQSAMTAVTVPYSSITVPGRGHAYDWSATNVAFAFNNFGALASNASAAQATLAATQTSALKVIDALTGAQTLVQPSNASSLALNVTASASQTTSVATQASALKAIASLTGAQTTAAATQASSVALTAVVTASQATSAATQAAGATANVAATASQTVSAATQSAASSSLIAVSAAQTMPLVSAGTVAHPVMCDAAQVASATTQSTLVTVTQIGQASVNAAQTTQAAFTTGSIKGTDALSGSQTTSAPANGATSAIQVRSNGAQVTSAPVASSSASVASQATVAQIMASALTGAAATVVIGAGVAQTMVKSFPSAIADVDVRTNGAQTMAATLQTFRLRHQNTRQRAAALLPF